MSKDQHDKHASRHGSDADLFEQAVAATLRALSGEKDLQAQYGVASASLQPSAYQIKTSESGERSARLPSIRDLGFDEDGVRGAADSIALYIDQHDTAHHLKYAPQNPQARLAYDILEQVRCEAAGSRYLHGVRGNILSAMEEQCVKKGYGNPEKPVVVSREDALFALSRKMFFEADDMESASRGAAAYWASWFVKKLGPEGFSELMNVIHDPAVFSKTASRLAVKLMVDAPAPDDADGDDEQNSSPQNAANSDGETPDDDQSTQDALADIQQQDGENNDSDESVGEEIADPEAPSHDMGADGEGDPLEQKRREGGTAQDEPPAYRIFTTDHDQTIEALDLATREELDTLRGKLDKQLDPLKTMIAKLANRLQRRLMAQQQRSWLFDVEEGLLDPARLARVVTTPGSPLSYKIEKDTDFKDTVVSLLIDNSGSMRGRPITIAALSTDILARTLERCGIKVEILGFTTSAWKGGMARDAWSRAGRPEQPGRLNDILHIVYKAADAPWIRTRKNIGLMLKEGLLKENIDGEALRWAYKRIRMRPEKRKIMMVISDGAPVDDSTLSANFAGFLEQDLRRTIKTIEQQKIAELLAIGIGHDVTQYYRRAVTIRQAEELGSTMIEELVRLFDPHA